MTASGGGRHLVWIAARSLNTTLDAATWLCTTRELRRLGWRVTLIHGGKAGPVELNGVETLSLPRPEVYLVRQMVFHIHAVRWILRHRRTIDVVLFHEMSAPWLVPLRYAVRARGMDRPAFVMDSRTLFMPPNERQSIRDRLRKWFYRCANTIGNRCDGRTAITHRMAESLGIPAGKLWGVWPSGVDLDRFQASRQRRVWPLQNDTVQLLHLGCQDHERNLLTLAHAVVEANREGQRFVLRLIGNGLQHDELKRFAAQAGGAIRVESAVPYAEVPEVLARAHVGMLPYADEEKFRVSSPIKLFEYLAAGLPVFATRIACHTDVVGSGACVFWADSASEADLVRALGRVWEGRGDLACRGEAAAIAANMWTWAASARGLEQAMQRHLGGPNELQAASVARDESTQRRSISITKKA